MELKENNVIKLECNNWYVRKDQLVQICSQDGGRVILNPEFTKLWINVEYEKTARNLWECVNNYFTWSEMEHALEEFVHHNLIRIIDEDDQFDDIFG